MQIFKIVSFLLIFELNCVKCMIDYVFAFNKYTSANSDNQGTPYDYSKLSMLIHDLLIRKTYLSFSDSIMHYGRTAFSSNGQPTMIPKDPKATIGDRTTLSPIDIQEIQKFYGCK